MIILIIWISLVIVNSIIRLYLFPLYFDLLPREKVERGYLKFSENFKYNHQTWVFKNSEDLRQDDIIHYRIDIQLVGLFRALFKKPLNFKKELKKLNSNITDVNAIDHSEFFKSKKTGKLIL